MGVEFKKRIVLVETPSVYQEMKELLQNQPVLSVDTETTGNEALRLWNEVAELEKQIASVTPLLDRVTHVYKKRYYQGRRKGYEAGGLAWRVKREEIKSFIHDLTLRRNAAERDALKNPGGLHFWENIVSCLQIGVDHRGNGNSATAYIIRPELVEPEWLQELLNTRQELYFHNAKFDLKQLMSGLGVYLLGDNLVDTQAREYVITMGTNARVGLDACLEKYCGVKKDKSVRLHNWSGLWSHEMISYAATDVLHLFDIARAQDPLIVGNLMDSIWLEQDLSVALAEMEIAGVGVNKKLAGLAAEQAEMHFQKLIQKVRDQLPGLENPMSNAQLLAYLRDVKGHPIDKVDKKAFKALKDLPYIQDILEMRKFYKVLGTYYGPLHDNCVQGQDGYFRIHGNYNALRSAKSEDDAGTDTGRLSSSEPNLQNQPKDSRITLEDGTEAKLREIFVPRPGFKFIVSDLDQIEPRILAFLSQDRELLRAFAEGIDPYCLMAEKMYGIPWQEVMDAHRAGDSARRDEMKIALLSVMYLKTAFGLNRDYPLVFPTEASAYRFLADIDRAFIGVKRWKIQTIARAKKNGYAEAASGRRRYIPALNAQEKWKRTTGERQAVNFEIQGLAAVGMKASIVLLRRMIRERGLQDKIIPVLTVHDELVIEALDDPEVVNVASELLERAMVEGTGQFLVARNEYESSVPVTAKAKVVNNWGEAK